MSSYASKTNLMKISGAFLTNLKGKTETKRCICIPIDSIDLYEGEKGIYLDMIHSEMREPKYADTHLSKASVKKEIYEGMTEEQRNNIPIIGSMRPLTIAVKQAEITTTMEAEGGAGDDLPF